MGSSIINDLLQKGGPQVSITLTVGDLISFANTIASNVAQNVIGGAVEAISEAMGDNLKYCSRKETIKLLRCSSSTLSRWEKKKYITAQKIGGKNLYLRQEVLALAKKEG